MHTQLIKFTKKNITAEHFESKLLRWSRVCVRFIRAAQHPLLHWQALGSTTPLTLLWPDWDLWAYITSINCPAATSSELCPPHPKNTPHLSALFWVPPFGLISSVTGAGVMSTGMKSWLPGSGVCVRCGFCYEGSIWVATRGEARWEDVGRTAVVWHQPWWGRTSH